MRRTLVVLALLAFAPPASAQQAPQVVFVQEKNPVAAGIFSILIPGAGQAYNGQWNKAWGFFLGVGLGAVATSEASANEDADCDQRTAEWEASNPPVGSSISCSKKTSAALTMATLGLWVWNVIDAPRSANKLNAEARARVQPTVARDGRVGLQVSIPTP